MGVQRMLISIF